MRRMKTASVLVAAAALSLVGLGSTAANAGTGVTFTITSGGISITEPAPVANLGSVASSSTGTTTSGLLGATTVTDNRGSLSGWTTTISTTDFSDGASHTIAAAKAKAYVLATNGPTLVSGVAVPTTSYATALTALTLANTAADFVTSTSVGSNVVTFNPTMALTIDSNVVAGTYTGTVTQTVS